MTRSAYADRDTVGTIALKAAKLNDRITVGDMSRELMPQLVDDLNEAIASNPFDGRPFYITIHEKKDAQLTNVFNRRVIHTEYRPYPEENTDVFWYNPRTNETLYCWSLPHRTKWPNYFANPRNYDKDQLKDIIAYKLMRLDHFGFYQAGETENKTPIFYPIPNFRDRKLRK